VTKRNNLSLLKVSEEINDPKNKEDYEEYLGILQTLLHDVWILSVGAGGEQLVNVDIRESLEKAAAGAERRKLAEWLGDIETLRANLAVNVNRKIATNSLFVQMSGG
jgi:hypothetical protein